MEVHSATSKPGISSPTEEVQAETYQGNAYPVDVLSLTPPPRAHGSGVEQAQHVGSDLGTVHLFKLTG